VLAEKSEVAYQHAEKLENDILTLMQNKDPFICDMK